MPKETRGWDDAANITRAQRHKEETSDYRYFPEPDLVPVTVTEEEVESVRAALGQLPADLRTLLVATYGISDYDSDVLVNQGQSLVDYFVELAQLTGDGKAASNWMQQDVLRTLNERGTTLEDFPIAPAGLAELIARVQAGDLDTSRGREVFNEMVASGQTAAQIIAAKGIARVDESELIAICQEVVAANPKIVADIKAGKLQAAGNLVGQVKKRNPNVNPGRVREICLELANQM